MKLAITSLFVVTLILAGCSGKGLVAGETPPAGEPRPVPGGEKRAEAAQRQEDLGKSIKAGDLEAVKRTLQEHPEALDARNLNGFTPLLLAGYHGRAEIGLYLVEAGADIEAQDPMGNNAYMAAASGGSTDLIRVLLEKGADPRFRNRLGQSALHQACLLGRLEAVQLLIGEGADVNAVDESGATPLYWAASKNQLPIAELLIEKGAKLDVATISQRMRPIDAARVHQHQRMVELLQDHGADA
ncbi:MAG: ankyrin repeat domain-containing protein [Armatimonadetes bacterium]|nr:ankyrin repeat domain-containing protein [Armatimonadota bacterium]